MQTVGKAGELESESPWCSPNDKRLRRKNASGCYGGRRQATLERARWCCLAQMRKRTLSSLRAPDSVELCWALRQKGFDLPLDALTPEECAQALYDWLKA